MPVTNNNNITLPLAVWLLHDEYDGDHDLLNYISVTALMKPVKQIILPRRIPNEQRTVDIADLVARKLGNSIHDSIERAWNVGSSRALRALGYPEDVISRVIVNPTTEQMNNVKDIIPVWLENRGFREIEVDGVTYTLGGKFDMVADGLLNDHKSSSAYSWVFGTNDENHALQMSMYRWIDQDRTDKEKPRITEDICNVNYVFTDWQKAQASSNPKYPQNRVEQKTLNLLDLNKTEEYIRNKIRSIVKNQDAPQSDMDRCSDEELWRSETVYKYYTDPEKANVPGSRATRNFTNLAEANAFKASKGKGIVLEIPGEVKACGYCDAFDICEQRKEYFNV